MSSEEFEALPDYSDRSLLTRSSLDSIITQSHSTSSQHFDTLQTPPLESIERSPIQVQSDLFTVARPPEESLWSYHTMFNYRETQRRLYAQDTEVNDERIRRDSVRLFLSVAGSDFKKAQNLRCEELCALTKTPNVEVESWLRNTYHEFTRPLSMDAANWTDWNTPACPWTTWKASWNERGIHVLPPKKHCGRKHTLPRRIMGHFFNLFQPELSPKAPETPPNVSALRRTLPSDRPQAPSGRSPTPAQGGFIENLEENARYQDMLDNGRRRGATRTKRSMHVVAREAIMEAQNDTETKDEAQVHTGRKDVPEDDAATTKGRRKRDIFGTAMKAILCRAKDTS
jgi:hypothetical protein